MKIVVAGGTGFIGDALVQRFVARGDDVAVLSRNPSKVRAGRGLEWDGRTKGRWSREAADADVIVNLAGENIGDGRWAAARKRRIIDSRVNATRALVEALREQPSANGRVLVNASATGIYGDRGDEVLDEESTRGEGFLADVVDLWESEARAAASLRRLVILRFGVAFAPDGGALKQMMLPFRFGAGGPAGSGEQWMSWIDRRDLIRAIEFAVDHREVRGVYNTTSPEPVRNRDLAKALGRAMGRPSFMRAPAFALKIALGQMAEELLLASQRAVPRRLEAAGFKFEWPRVEEALQSVR